MHREISHGDQNFEQESRLSLYLLTGLLGLLLAADLYPGFARWVGGWGPKLPTYSNEFYGYRNAFALLAAVLGGACALYGSLDALFAGRVGADLALALACVAAMLLREPLVAAEIVFIGMVGECLESVTFERTQRAVRRSSTSFRTERWRLRDGQEERVLVSELQVGDRVVVKPGGGVPVDGVVLDGRSAVDVSALTGESLPVDKGPGDEVLAGSLNQFGALTVEARRVAEQTVAGRVIELTAKALKDKAPLERNADRLARYFLPAVLGLALLTFVGAMVIHGGNWFRPADSQKLTLGEAARLSAYPALSVLVVACPCALILATPAAVIAALGGSPAPASSSRAARPWNGWRRSTPSPSTRPARSPRAGLKSATSCRCPPLAKKGTVPRKKGDSPLFRRPTTCCAPPPVRSGAASTFSPGSCCRKRVGVTFRWNRARSSSPTPAPASRRRRSRGRSSSAMPACFRKRGSRWRRR